MSKHGSLRVLALVILVIFISTSCASSDGALPEYPQGTGLSVALGTSVSLDASGADSDGKIRLSDGNTYTPGELKPVFSAISRDLGISLSDAPTESADIFIGGIDDINLLGQRGKVLNLYEYGEYTESLTYYLAHNLDVRDAVSVNGNRKLIYSAPVVSTAPSLDDVIFLDAESVRKLLDGGGEYSAVGDAMLPELAYSPLMPTSGTVDVTVTDSDGESTVITKNYSAAGNITVTLGVLSELGETDASSAVRALRTYIDDAYGGYYGNERSALFLGPSAAYDVDELVALLTVMCAVYGSDNGEFRDTGATYDLISTAIFGDPTYTHHVGALADAGLLDLICVGSPTDPIPDAYAPILPPFVIAPAEDEDAIPYTDESTEDTDEAPEIAYERRISMTSVASDYGIAIRSEVANDASRLSAALAFIDFIYSDVGRLLVSLGTDGFFDTDAQSTATARDASTRGLSTVEYARDYIGSAILMTDRMVMTLDLSDGARRALDLIYTAIDGGTVVLRD